MGATADATKKSAPGASDVDALYREQWPELLRLAFFLVGERRRAERIVQDAFLRLERARPPARAKSDLRKVTVRLTRRRVVHRGCPPNPLGVDGMSETDRLCARLWSLPRPEREALVVRYCADVRVEDVAEALGRPLETTVYLIKRGLASLVAAPGQQPTMEAFGHAERELRRACQAVAAALRGEPAHSWQEQRSLRLAGLGPVRRRAVIRPVPMAAAAATVVIAATATAILFAAGQPSAQPPPIVLNDGGYHVLVQRYGHGDAVLRFTTTPRARWEVVCRPSEQLPPQETVVLKVLGQSREDFGWAYCPTGASDTLPPTASGPFTIFIKTSSHVSWGFEVFTSPQLVPASGS